MKKSEFLSQLRKALENELDARAVKENVDYYEDYIRSEMESGKSEEETIAQLGDPWAIAKTILLSEKMGGQDSGRSYESPAKQDDESDVPSMRDLKWKGILAIIILVIVVVLVLSMVFGILAIVARLAVRFAVPILVILLLAKWLSKKK